MGRLRLASAALAVAGCSLVVDTSELTGGEAPPRDAPVAAAPDGGDAGDSAVPDGDTQPAEAGFHDGFDRPDSDALGYGWTEKTPGAFTLEAGRVVKLATTTSYRDNMVYRPSSEDARDVEASIEVHVGTPVQFPQIFVRAQRATISDSGSYDGYLLYLQDSTTKAILGRQRGSAFVVTLATLDLAPALDPAVRHRLRLSAQGTSPVELEAYVERLEGGAWKPNGRATFSDAAPERIAEAGAVGFAANEAATPVYDDFRWRPLAPPP